MIMYGTVSVTYNIIIILWEEYFILEYNWYMGWGGICKPPQNYISQITNIGIRKTIIGPIKRS